MEKEEKEFELVPEQDKNTGVYVVANYEENKQLVEKFIANDCHLNDKIESDADLKIIKNTRTDIRKKADVIKNARINVTKMLTGTFEEQLKEIEKMLSSADSTLREKVTAYEAEHKSKIATPKKITLVVKSYDMKLIEKVKAYAIKNGLEANIDN